MSKCYKVKVKNVESATADAEDAHVTEKTEKGREHGDFVLMHLSGLVG